MVHARLNLLLCIMLVFVGTSESSLKCWKCEDCNAPGANKTEEQCKDGGEDGFPGGSKETAASPARFIERDGDGADPTPEGAASAVGGGDVTPGGQRVAADETTTLAAGTVGDPGRYKCVTFTGKTKGDNPKDIVIKGCSLQGKCQDAIFAKADVKKCVPCETNLCNTGEYIQPISILILMIALASLVTSYN